ncbi:hypothetical protein RRG08_003079 [Elysia crispata]|uniref:ERC protein 2 n=1 Tax=Elysia crispata TaxID=231223 RepID=A0AAE1B745_9GAST|nr:hypothetical protein RRG08_003079 [Elysia crispata]
MIKMFSKSRSSRRKEKNRDGSGSSQSPNLGGSLSRAQAEAMYSNTSPARSSSTGYSSATYSGSSIERPVRGRAMSDGSPAEYSVSSPLDFPMEHLQSFHATYGLNPSQRTYIDSRPVPRHTPLNSLISPTHSRTLGSRANVLSQSQSHVRANSTSNLGNSMRERSLDRVERDGSYLGDASLDRHFEQMHYNMQMDNRLNTEARYNTTGRDRSLDREYPHMGARSLERDPNSVSRSRSMDRGGEYNYPSATLPSMPLLSHTSSMQSDHSSHEFRNSLVFEMQVQISDLHKEVSRLQKDLDQTREKLSSSMNSIKTFWSPELKKERAVRKEEAARCNLLNEQLKVTQAELKKHREILKGMGDGTGTAGSSTISADTAKLQQEKDLQGREMIIMKKTIEELEIRIESQKQTLEARDESIKKLLEMLHSKGVNVTKIEEDRRCLEAFSEQLKQEERKRKQAEEELGKRDLTVMELTMELNQVKEKRPDAISLTGDHKMEAMLDAKNSRITSLEREVQQLEDKLLKAKEDSAGLPPSGRDIAIRDLASAKEKLLKAEVQALKDRVEKKDAELASLRLKVDTQDRQHTEKEGHISVLKDKVSSKERQTTMLQTELEGLQDRIKTKEDMIDRKNKECAAVQAEKRRLELEVMELKDQLEIKTNRISNLQRKIEGLEDTIREKEDQLSQARIRLTSTFTESPSDSTLSALEATMAEKDKQIDKLKEQRDRSEKEHQDELDLYTKKAQDLKVNLDKLQKELTSKQTEMCELREQMTELQAARFEQEARCRKLEAEVVERQADLQRSLLETEQVRELMAKAEKEKMELEAQNKAATENLPANLTRQDKKHLQEELEKLQDMLKDAEVEKTEKDAEIKELQDVVKEYKQKMGTLKRNQQTEKKKNAQLLEEARKREDSMSDESSHLSTAIKKSTDRVEELEEALRQSVIITAEREMAMADMQGQIEDAKTAMEELQAEVERLHKGSQEQDKKMAALTKQMEEKEIKMQKWSSDRQKHLQEAYEMKQEAIQSAISDKDSMLALLEMTSVKNQKNMTEIDRLMRDKHQLQYQLREVTTKRMKLAHRGERRSESRERCSEKSIYGHDGGNKRSVSANNSPTFTRRAQPTLPNKAKSAGSSPIEDERGADVPTNIAAVDAKSPPPSTGTTPTGTTPPVPLQGEFLSTAAGGNAASQGSGEAPEAAISVTNGGDGGCDTETEKTNGASKK